MLSCGRTSLDGHQWCVLRSSQDRTSYQAHRSETKGAEARNSFIPVQKEEGDDNSSCSHYHCRITANRVSASPVESASDTNKGSGEKDGSRNVQVQVHSSEWRIVQTPKHEKQTDEQISCAIDDNLSA